ncbi:MAG TPA: TIM-barrel domain-containing protein [Bacillales bacterium]|nr:TIM-barrel domain-containing protein [Bacillales bacterium]
MENLTYKGKNYELFFCEDRPFVHLKDAAGDLLAELFVLSSVHTLSGLDDAPKIGEWQAADIDGERVFSLTAKSTVWDQKTYRFKCNEERFTYEIEVDGFGSITNADYFGGYYSGNVRWGSGFFWSGHRWSRGFNPEPNTDEVHHFQPDAGSVIDLTGVPIPGKGDWFFTPPPFCFAFEGSSGWLGIGVEAEAGENRFTEYHYRAQGSGFHLQTAYEGHTEVRGNYVLPAIGFDFAADEYAALDAHVTALQAAGYVSEAREVQHPEWWKQPIFCGWGSQCHVAAVEQGHAPNYARQELYENFMKKLQANDVSPKIVVLDDKWQASYGENAVDEEKWPDLRGFIDERHANGQKVLLWLKAWDPEGVPAEECIRNAAGMPIAIDPTHPGFEQRMRKSVRRMISADGYDADGFKIDFTARIPSGPGIEVHGEQWGLELMKQYLFILNDEAKAVKPDALIMSHTPHPYLADVIDMIRLNDINTGKDINAAMTHRAKVAKAACPAAVIDTDNWPMTDKKSWREYVRLQPELGVPSLYFVSHIDSTKEALEEEDYALVRESWRKAQIQEEMK